MSKRGVKLFFWGVRGSTPTVDRNTWRYGGNTPCVEIETPEGDRFILDCGTGLRMLGNMWMERFPDAALEASVFLTHYHWDHIQGLPFFAPLYARSNHFHFYSFRSKFLGPNSLRQMLEAQMAFPYFPVDFRVAAAGREFTEIGGTERWEINGTRIRTAWLNHPQGCLGFRFETSAGTIVFTTDNEPGVPEFDKNLRQLAEGADVFINDAQYTPEQLAGVRKGWGHSTWLEGVNVAREAGARNLVLFHHDPDSTDKMVDGLLHEARQRFDHVWAASEAMTMTLAEHALEVNIGEPGPGERRKMYLSATVSGTGEDGRSFEEKTSTSELSLHGAQFRLKHSPPLQSQIQLEIETPTHDGSDPAPTTPLSGIVVRSESGPDGRALISVIFTQGGTPF